LAVDFVARFPCRCALQKARERFLPEDSRERHMIFFRVPIFSAANDDTRGVPINTLIEKPKTLRWLPVDYAAHSY
jgi:hypothetical protein